MTHLFCFACGSKLPDNVKVLFCPACGARMPEEGADSQTVPITSVEAGGNPPASPVKKPDFISRGGVTPSLRPSLVTQVHDKIGLQEEQSIILKSCPSPQIVLEELCAVLQRARLAVRMAVELTPSILMYKSKSEEVEKVLSILKKARCVVTVTKSGVEKEFDLVRVFPLLEQLDEKNQALLENVPRLLWLGEEVSDVFPDVIWNDVTGVLVVTQDHILFAGQGVEGDLIWHALPRYDLDEIQEQDQLGGGLVEIQHFGQKQILEFQEEDPYVKFSQELRTQ